MVFLLLCTANSEAVVSAGVCRHWAAAAVVVGIMSWPDMVPYSRLQAKGICRLPILKHIRCCSLDFSLTVRKEPRADGSWMTFCR